MFDWSSNRNRNRRRILDDVDALGRHLAFPWRCALIRVKYAEHYVLKCAYSCVNGISFTRAMAKTKVCMDASWQRQKCACMCHGKRQVCMDAWMQTCTPHIISFRRGDESTWQWLHAWLQWSPILTWQPKWVKIHHRVSQEQNSRKIFTMYKPSSTTNHCCFNLESGG